MDSLEHRSTLKRWQHKAYKASLPDPALHQICSAVKRLQVAKGAEDEEQIK
jgi:hypothetical protein